MPAPRILLVDDSSSVRAVARIELEEAGYDVLEAPDGAKAVAVAVASQPDVVLLDIAMPGMDGYETIQVLKADPRTTDIPVVFLTGRVGADDVVRGLGLGGHDFLRKPPEAGELLARVSAALRVKVLQDELRVRAEDFELMSRTDYLTGLHNRRHMEEHLLMLGSGAKRHGYPLAVLIVDIDHFKRVNDTLGHRAGDAVLVALATRLRQQLRTEDALGRWGGEEFLLLLPHTGTDAAVALADRLRTAVSGTPFTVDKHALKITISVGGAAADVPGEHDLLQLADRELYAVKESGRNGVQVARSAPRPRVS